MIRPDTPGEAPAASRNTLKGPPLLIRVLIWYINWRNQEQVHPATTHRWRQVLVIVVLALLALLLGSRNMSNLAPPHQLHPLASPGLVRPPGHTPDISTLSTAGGLQRQWLMSKIAVAVVPNPNTPRTFPLVGSTSRTLQPQASTCPNIGDPNFWQKLTECTFSDLVSWVTTQIFNQLQTPIHDSIASGLLTSTDPKLTYDNTITKDFFTASVIIVESLLTIYLMVVGYLVFVKGTQYYQVLQSLPGLALAVVAANFVNLFYPALIDLNNALCGQLAYKNAFNMLHAIIQTFMGGNGVGAGFLTVILGLILCILIIILAAQMVFRLAWLDVLLIFLPFGVFFLGHPLTQSLGKSIVLAFFATLYVQFVQVTAMVIGFTLIANFAANFTGEQSVTSLFIACATFYVAIRLPGIFGIASTRRSVADNAATTVINSYSQAYSTAVHTLVQL